MKFDIFTLRSIKDFEMISLRCLKISADFSFYTSSMLSSVQNPRLRYLYHRTIFRCVK